MRHVEKALEKARHYEKIGDLKTAEKFLKIAERYEVLIKKKEIENEKNKNKN